MQVGRTLDSDIFHALENDQDIDPALSLCPPLNVQSHVVDDPRQAGMPPRSADLGYRERREEHTGFYTLAVGPNQSAVSLEKRVRAGVRKLNGSRACPAAEP